ncbi:MAG: DUF1285 domain-containing protein [Cypionkella sp.]|jgi:hypothetical protein|nr:DUF1285 domain-containing protein [Cypionkella sp.]
MSDTPPKTPTAQGLTAALGALPPKGLPPVHLWNPPFCGDMDMRIARDGTWFHEGTPIGRPGMVKMFSSILKLEDGRFYLVTPVEKVGITVEDAPFLAIDLSVEGHGRDQRLIFRTKTEDEVVAGPDHALRVEQGATSGEPSPYIHIRGGMEALIDRKTFYRLVDLGVHETVDGTGWFGVWSQGLFFPMIRSADLT